MSLGFKRLIRLFLLTIFLAVRAGFSDFKIALVQFKNNHTTLLAIRQTKTCKLNK